MVCLLSTVFTTAVPGYPIPIIPNSGGDLWWFAVICGGLWSFAVVCGGLRWFVVVCLSHTEKNDAAGGAVNELARGPGSRNKTSEPVN